MEQNPILTNQLSLNSDIPLYSQLVGIIKRSISSGTLNVGDLLPSEAELCRALDVSRNTVRQAGGFIIQLMPFCDEKVIEKLEQRLAEVNSVTAFLDEGLTPEQILEKLLGDMDLVINDTVPTQFYCNCSRERVSKALIAVGRKELNEMIQEAKPVELKCHFCNSAYEFSTEDLKELLRKSK